MLLLTENSKWGAVPWELSTMEGEREQKASVKRAKLCYRLSFNSSKIGEITEVCIF